MAVKICRSVTAPVLIPASCAVLSSKMGFVGLLTIFEVALLRRLKEVSWAVR